MVGQNNQQVPCVLSGDDWSNGQCMWTYDFHSQHQTGENSPKLCLGICKREGQPFAGVEPSRCLCLNEDHIAKADKKDKSMCDSPCPGDSSSMCGSPTHANVYKTGGKKLILKSPEGKSLFNTRCMD